MVNNQEIINEASLGRFWKHYNDNEPIAFISADRNENTKQENKANYQKLKNAVSMAGFGYNRIKGGYVEEGGVRVEDENSLVIYASKDREKELLKLVMSLGIRFKQSSIMFIDTDGNVNWYSTRNDCWFGKIGTKKPLGKFQTNNINDFFTKIGKKEFKFKSLDESEIYKPSLSERQLSSEFKRLLKNLSDTDENVMDVWDSRFVENSIPEDDMKEIKKLSELFSQIINDDVRNVHTGTGRSKKYDKKDKDRIEKEQSKVSEFPDFYKKEGWEFIALGNHAKARAFQRRPDMTDKDWKSLHSKVFWKIRDDKLKSGVYLFYSKSMEQGYVCRVLKDKKQVKIITVLPKGAKNPSLGSDTQEKTQLAVMEGAEYSTEMVLLESGITQYEFIELE
nr:MAG TPA: hypothetical protein [Caudoviricetes sp.]